MLNPFHKPAKIAVLMLSVVIFSANSWAQTGKVLLNAGATFSRQNAGPALSAQYFVTKSFSIGYQNYSLMQEVDLYQGSSFAVSEETTTSFDALRGDVHLNGILPNISERIDPYVGVTAGKIHIKATYQYGSGPVVKINRSYDGITVLVPVGFRYWFGKHIGAYAEYNIGVANLTADIDGSSKRESIYAKRQYQLGIGLSVRF